LQLSTIGLGTYLGEADVATDAAYREAISTALQRGCNVVDSAINYRFQRSERAIGAALYAIFSFIFNGSVFVVPSVSQVALRPAIVIPMFFGYTFGPVVGFFTGAVVQDDFPDGGLIGDSTLARVGFSCSDDGVFLRCGSIFR
jgi:hypothetical protein